MASHLIQVTSEHRQKLLLMRERIVQELKEPDDVVEYMQDNEALDDYQAQSILCEDTDIDKTRKLLALLPTLSERAYQVFKIATFSQSVDLYNELKDSNERTEVIPVLLGAVKRYIDGILRLHHRILEDFRRLQKSQSATDSLNFYITLLLYPQKSNILKPSNLRYGFQELNLEMVKTLGSPLEASDLFTPLDSEGNKDVEKVLLLGAPGVGKTMTAYHWLQEHVRGNLWTGDFHFVIFILFRDVNNFTKDISLYDILFNNFGPGVTNAKDKNIIWNFIKQNQKKILIILEGFDEFAGSDASLSIPVHDPLSKENIKTLICNLINRSLLPECKILITSRPHCVDQLEGMVDRIVELGGLDEGQLMELIKKKLESNPKLCRSLCEYMMKHKDLANLCSIPVNAQGMIDYVRWQCSGDSVMESKMPKTRACLIFLLIINLIRHHDQSLQKNHRLTSWDILNDNRKMLQNLANMAHAALFDEQRKTTKQIFTEEDLREHGLTADQVTRSGLMVGQVSSVLDLMGPVVKSMFSFPHLTFEDHMAAIRHCLFELTELLVSFDKNSGDQDVLQLLTIGLMGDTMCHKMMSLVYPQQTKNQNWCDKARKLFHALVSSARRYHTNGYMFCIKSMAEGLQFEETETLAQTIITPINTLYLGDTPISPGDFSPLALFLDHLPEPLEEVLINTTTDHTGLSEVLSAKGFIGMTLVAPHYTQSSLSTIFRCVNKHNVMKRLVLQGTKNKPCSVEHWNKVEIIDKCQLQCLALMTGMIDSDDTFFYISEKLRKMKHLEGLCIMSNKIDKAPHLSFLAELSLLKYLRISRAGLSADHVPAIISVMRETAIIYLDLSENPLGNEAVAELAGEISSNKSLKGLRLKQCSMGKIGLEAIRSALQHNETMTVLNVNSNDFSFCSESLVGVIQCSKLKELYTFQCGLDPHTLCQVMEALEENRCLESLNIGYNSIDKNVIRSICNMLTKNQFLKALNLMNTGLTNETMEQLATILPKNRTLQMLDISENPRLSATPVLQVIVNSHIYYLSAANLNLEPSEMEMIAKALLSNTNIQQLVTGDEELLDKRNLAGFLEILCKYPKTGPLKHLMIYGKSSFLAEPLQKLKQNLQGRTSVSIVKLTLPFLNLTGFLNSCVPREISIWLLTGYASIM